jgi:tetrahydromethanopterin S-methyltransferase subunit F
VASVMGFAFGVVVEGVLIVIGLTVAVLLNKV